MKTLLTIGILILSTLGMNSYSQISLEQGSNSLINSIMTSTGVDKDQAMGGTGALFEMAKGKMDKTDFDKVSDVVPDMDSMMDAIPALSGGSSMLGSVATTLTGMPKVLAVFDKLGISQDKVALFTPIIVNYVEDKGGEALGKILGDSLK